MEEKNQNIKQHMSKKNRVAEFFKVLTIIIFILGTVISCFIMFEAFEIIPALISLAVSYIPCIFLMFFAELLQLVEDIKNK